MLYKNTLIYNYLNNLTESFKVVKLGLCAIFLEGEESDAVEEKLVLNVELTHVKEFLELLGFLAVKGILFLYDSEELHKIYLVGGLVQPVVNDIVLLEDVVNLLEHSEMFSLLEGR